MRQIRSPSAGLARDGTKSWLADWSVFKSLRAMHLNASMPLAHDWNF
jgi:hypothetical protein